MKISTSFSNAATRTIVAQVGNLPCRRLAAGKAVECGGGCGLSIRDTADCQSALRRQSGFTMVEIAICLAVIGIALISIIGVLPIGMHTQRDNREETIINQDATVFIEAIRGGARGLDDLTNYVYAITNYWTYYPVSGAINSGVNGYTYVASSTTPSTPYYPSSPITNGMNIIGLLSTSEFMDVNGTPLANITGINYYSNHIVAYVRSLSGPAVEKPPQPNDSIIREDSFGYRILCVNAPITMNTPPIRGQQSYNAGDNVSYILPGQTTYSYWQAIVAGQPPLPPQSSDVPGNSVRWARNLYPQELAANLHELRLTFLWPQQPNGKVGIGRQTFRTMVAGQLAQNPANGNLYFYQSQSFVNTP
jgi:prepilin-type N-terminal cleavage/methylation domain-containing protein